MTDDNNYIELTRRRVIGGLAAFGAAGAATGAGTVAYFSDSEESTDNQIESGEITLDAGNDNINNAAVRVDTVEPGETNTKTLNLRNTGSINGFLSLDFGVPNNRNDLTEVLEVEISIAGNTIRKGTFGTVFDGEGEWSNADIPLGAKTTKTLAFEYTLPSGASQTGTQSAMAEATFDILLNQQEEAFADLVVDDSGSGDVSSIQAGVDAAPSGAVVLVRDGTYNEAVDITKSGQKLASKNGFANTKIRADASNDNRAVQVTGVTGVTVDGFDITFDGNASPNAEKYGLQADAGSDGITVRNCRIGGYTTAEAGRSGVNAVRSTGVTLRGSSPISAPVIENNTFTEIRCAGSTTQNGSKDSDSRAKGLALNGEIDNAAVIYNEFTGIGGTSNDPAGAQISTVTDVSSPDGTGSLTTGSPDNQDAEGTDKPRGISIIEGGGSTTPTGFTILRNTFGGTGSDAIAGVYGQPSIFLGDSGSLGDHEVYNNTFYHPIDNLRGGGGLRLRENTYENNGGYPGLEPADQDKDGGVLIDRASGSNYDTTFTL